MVQVVELLSSMPETLGSLPVAWPLTLSQTKKGNNGPEILYLLLVHANFTRSKTREKI